MTRNHELECAISRAFQPRKPKRRRARGICGRAAPDATGRCANRATGFIVLDGIERTICASCREDIKRVAEEATR